MWVRSQDKNSLINCNEFYIVTLFSGGYSINCKTTTIVKELGTYSTKEKAVKVLDDIQKAIRLLKGKELTALLAPRTLVHINTDNYVIEMPTDEEVK